MAAKEFIKSNFQEIELLYDIYRDRRYSSVNPEDYPQEIEKWYKKSTGEDLDLQHPINYTQKLQWLKLYDSTKEKALLSDKYRVREWIKEKIGEEYLAPMICGNIKNANDIEFEKLPDRFVLKANHGSGWNIIVKDKSKLNIRRTKHILNSWLKLNYAFVSGYELHYQYIEPCIIIEEYMENLDGELNDYKFLCFNGKPMYCWVDVDRYKNHKRNIYDMKWNLQPWTIHTFANTGSPLERPINFDKMVELAEILSKGFKHVRVDFYNIRGKIIFGEMTFTNGSGQELIHPSEMNIVLGNYIDISRDI